MYAIVLIPDLDLIDERGDYGDLFTRNFIESTNALPHLMDISELLRMVQAANVISAQNRSISLMMAFDFYLARRSENAARAGSLCIEMLFRTAGENS